MKSKEITVLMVKPNENPKEHVDIRLFIIGVLSVGGALMVFAARLILKNG